MSLDPRVYALEPTRGETQFPLPKAERKGRKGNLEISKHPGDIFGNE